METRDQLIYEIYERLKKLEAQESSSTSKENIVAVLPCKVGSQRVINKNTREFSEKSLVEIKLGQLTKVPEISKIIVSTNDSIVVDVCKKMNHPKIEIHWEVRSEESRKNNMGMVDYFAEVFNFDGHLLWTHVTSPFINEETYSRAIKLYLENLHKHDSLVSVNKIKGYLWGEDKKPITYDLERDSRWPKTQNTKACYLINSGIFLLPLKTLKEKKDRLGDNPIYFECNEIEGLDIDWQEDFDLAQMVWNAFKSHGLV